MEAIRPMDYDGLKMWCEVSLVRGVWVVAISHGDPTENRSFRNEIDARAYAGARVDQLRSSREDIPINPKIT
jgi:hypothetical protein